MRMHLAVAFLAAIMAGPTYAGFREVDRWPMNEPSGSGDLHGVNGHNGKYFNVQRYSNPCVSVSCFGFNGINAWARVTDFADLDHTEPQMDYGIVIHWQRTGNAPAGGADKLFLRGTPNSSQGWELEQRTGLDGQVRVCFSVRGSAASLLGLCSQPLTAVGLHDIQAWIRPPTVKLYVNGELHANFVRSIGTIISDKGLTICRSYGQATGWCNGFMDNIKILKEF